jgi:hypothetical protein
MFLSFTSKWLWWEAKICCHVTQKTSQFIYSVIDLLNFMQWNNQTDIVRTSPSRKSLSQHLYLIFGVHMVQTKSLLYILCQWPLDTVKCLLRTCNTNSSRPWLQLDPIPPSPPYTTHRMTAVLIWQFTGRFCTPQKA